MKDIIKLLLVFKVEINKMLEDPKKFYALCLSGLMGILIWNVAPIIHAIAPNGLIN